MTRLLAALNTALGGLLFAGTCLAQDYPNKPVRFIVPYAPGGSSDVLARTVGQKLSESLGQSFVVDNRPGAGSMVGTEALAKSPADGYTLILSDMPHAINPSIHPKLPFDPLNDFSPVSTIGVSPMFLFVHSSFEAKSVKELIALAKVEPGKLAIASGGNGATTHLVAELLQAAAGIKLIHVPYKGAGPAIADVAAGQVPITFTSMATAAPFVKSNRLRILGVTSAKRLIAFPDVPYKGAGPAIADVAAGQVPITFTSMATAAPFVKSNRLRILGVTSAKRLGAFPDVPTFDELGLAGLSFEHWWGVMAPARTPPAVVAKLNAEIGKALAAPDLRERFAALAVEPRANTPEQFRALIAADLTRWAKVVRDAGIKAE